MHDPRKGLAMAVPDEHVRKELIEQLGQANDRFHQAREEWEKRLAATELDEAERVDEAREKLRLAERDVQEVEERIRKTMFPDKNAAGMKAKPVEGPQPPDTSA
jgi:hypothetical protein